MSRTMYKCVARSKIYSYVYEITNGQRTLWKAEFNLTKATRNSKIYDTEREAAIAVDKFLISHGREPVNIFKRKSP